MVAVVTLSELHHQIATLRANHAPDSQIKTVREAIRRLEVQKPKLVLVK